jgi:hypothetical protein
VVREGRQGFAGLRDTQFILRFGEGRFVVVPAGDLRPLSALATSEIDGSGLEPLFDGSAPFMVAGDTASDLLVPLRVAGRVIGALELLGAAPVPSGHPVTAAQLFADLMRRIWSWCGGRRSSQAGGRFSPVRRFVGSSVGRLVGLSY